MLPHNGLLHLCFGGQGQRCWNTESIYVCLHILCNAIQMICRDGHVDVDTVFLKVESIELVMLVICVN